MGSDNAYSAEDPTVPDYYSLQDDDQRFSLCWNGEVWGAPESLVAGNDTIAVHRLFTNALSRESVSADATKGVKAIAEAISQFAGPYAFVLYDRLHGRLFFGRDFLGRRSLCVRDSGEGDVIISSVADVDLQPGWTEIEADGLYCLDLRIANGESRLCTTSAAKNIGQFRVEHTAYSFSKSSWDVIATSESMIPRLSLDRGLLAIHESLDEASSAVLQLEALLGASLAFRVKNIPNPPSAAKVQLPSSVARLAILFSGGLDCTVLARMCHDLLPLTDSIDLLNAAFENPRIHHSPHGNVANPYEQCPDRITGRSSHAELERVCPGRKWRFVAIDIPYKESMQHRCDVISLMHPHNTEMDLSISFALYFAARAIGTVRESAAAEPLQYFSTARVLLSGLGADELFGGYQRHATAFLRRGIAGLLDELELDVQRLGQRNLGRDDRVMSHWGKEVRFPYLDEALLTWALTAPVGAKCGFLEQDLAHESLNAPTSRSLEAGKKVLRCVAWRLGMASVAKEKKRAIQFGARTAKMHNGKVKGTQLLS